ncbi:MULTISPECIES: hypothetical protein [unclassified Sphingobacterium]|uniref:hypothetical protein n=1 Tax=unclassified Sphingobacterium TaxID=2609468 RepID=UPI0020C24FFD|nr:MULTISPECIES: hypothetical protein [unclassified Sphingobacterium]
MQKSDIPNFISSSGVFNVQELEQLASIEAIPTDGEIDSFKYEPEIQELLNAFIGDESTRITHQLLKAKEFLNQGRVEEAWKLMLL